MKRYFAFAGAAYYPAGGMDDFVGSFDTKKEAVESAEKARESNRVEPDPKCEYTWAHVFDSAKGKIIWERNSANN